MAEASIDPALEAQYNIRRAIPGFPAVFARWRERSAAARARLRCRLDLAYGADEAETLDLFLPEGEGPFPVQMFIHGGYWQAMDKSDFSYLAEALVEAGIAVAVVNYALCPQTTIDAIAGQMRRALAWLAREAAGLGLDAGRLQVAGHSAGGHLVAMLMADRPSAGRLCSGIAISGLFDLEPLRATSINAALGLDAAAARRASPLFMTPAGGAPLALAVGGAETLAFHDQADALAARWGAAGARIERVALPGRDHFAAVDALAEPESPLFAAALRLLKGGPGA